MRVVAKDIDETVLTIIRKQAELLLNTSNLDELTPKKEGGQELAEYENRIAKLNEHRQRLYERFIPISN